MTRGGDWILTYTGREFYPLDSRPGDIVIEDIAHALSMQCRFTGHCRQFYSVAEHSLRVAELVPPEDALWALLHDAAEAYLIDLPRPIKRHSEIGRLYREAEDALMGVIAERFGLGPEPPSIARADKGMLSIEAECLLPDHPAFEKWECFRSGKERGIGITLTPQAARREFLREFSALTGTRNVRF